MAGYFTPLHKTIERWREAGLIDAPTAAALLHDAERQAKRPSLGAVLAILAAALLGAALILLIASNWEAIPRLLRVAAIFAVILAGYLGGALLKLRGEHGFAEAAWLLGAVAFGAGIALVGQMYHLSGDERQAILVWCAGTALAAAALRSHPLTVGAVLLLLAWLLTGVGFAAPGPAAPLGFLALAGLLWLLSLWTSSRTSRQLVVLSLMLFSFIHHLDTESLAAPVTLALLSVLLFGFAVYAPAHAGRAARLGGGPVLGLLGFLVAMWSLHFTHDEGWRFGLLAAVVFAGIVAALLAGGRGDGGLRRLAYAAFALELCLVFVVLVGTMLDTVTFFLVAGLALAALAWTIGRFEKRLGRQVEEAGP